MSKSVVSPINKKKVKFASSVKYAVAKTSTTVVQNPSLLLLTVQYPQHGLPKSPKSIVQGIDVSSVNTQSNLVQRTEAVPYTFLHLAQPVMNGVMYYGANVQSNTVSKPVSSNNPILTRINETDHNYVSTVPKGSYPQNDISENIVVAPLPKSVVCTVMPKDCVEPQGVSKLEAALRRSDKPKPGVGVAKFGDWEDFSSGEEGSVHIIADKPVICRAVASLPAKFLYFGRTANKSSKRKAQGVFAKREIPKRALFGPMEGIHQDKSHLSGHHCELTIENNGELKRLDVTNENTSNWMRYVRNAESAGEQNLSLQQIGKNLYFVALRKIAPHEELKVWYSTSYARARNLPVLNITWNKKIKKGNKKHGRHVSGKENVSDKSGIGVEASKWKCSHCHKAFRSATPLNLHVLTHAADNLETKEKFNFNDSSSSVDVEFTTIDDDNDKDHLTCDDCNKTFLSVAALACHVKTHASVKTFDCPICNEIFDKVLHLKQHIRTHSVEGNFVCPYSNCSKKYPEYRHIRNHIRRFHCEKLFGCLQCSKHFSTLDKLKLHMLSHSDHRAFSCATCGRQFKRKDKLSVHMKRIHLFPKKRSEATDTSQNDKNSTPQKEVNETDYSEYVYKCHSCVVGFKRRGMLVNHLANRHPEIKPASVPELNLPILKANKDYYCQYCDKIYKSSSKRKAHILKNHPGKKLPSSNRKMSSEEAVANETYSQTVGSVTTNPQSCDWCHKQYASKAKLLQHQRKKHLNQLPKSLQHPKKSATINLDEDTDTIRDAIEKVIETEIFLPETLGISEYDTPVGDNKFFSGGEFIIDANTLKRAIRGEVLSADCTPETLSELGQIIDARPDGYFKVYQAPSGITLAHPVEVWDPFQLSLSPSSEATPISSS